MLTLRPWLIGQPFRIGALAEAVAEITSWPGVWSASAGDIVDAYRAATAGPTATSLPPHGG